MQGVHRGYTMGKPSEEGSGGEEVSIAYAAMNHDYFLDDPDNPVPHTL